MKLVIHRLFFLSAEPFFAGSDRGSASRGEKIVFSDKETGTIKTTRIRHHRFELFHASSTEQKESSCIAVGSSAKRTPEYLSIAVQAAGVLAAGEAPASFGPDAPETRGSAVRWHKEATEKKEITADTDTVFAPGSAAWPRSSTPVGSEREGGAAAAERTDPLNRPAEPGSVRSAAAVASKTPAVPGRC